MNFVSVLLVAICIIASSDAQDNRFPGKAGYEFNTPGYIAITHGDQACRTNDPAKHLKRIEETNKARPDVPNSGRNTKAEFLGKILPTAKDLVKDCCDTSKPRPRKMDKCDDTKLKEIVEKGLQRPIGSGSDGSDSSGSGSDGSGSGDSGSGTGKMSAAIFTQNVIATSAIAALRFLGLWFNCI